MQFHARGGTVYEFQREDTKLSLRVTPRSSAADCGDWRIEAAAVHGMTDVAIVEWGPTRAETLCEVGRSWRRQAESRGLPQFDWDEVARLMASVSAL
jgi:hypothetical protein